MHTLHINGQIFALKAPCVMAIINLTPDSFYRSCGQDVAQVIQQVEKALQEGAQIIDLGAYSSRPNAAEVSADDEWNRLQPALQAIRKRFPNIILSVDTFRAEIARKAVVDYGVQIINDISAGEADPAMFQTIADLQVIYCMMHMRGTPQTMQTLTDYDNLLSQIIHYFQGKIDTLHRLGVKDIIIDPGFGFAKTTEQNYELLHHLHYLHTLNLSILVGLSRKSMVYKPLSITPQDALNGTTVLHTLALTQGANILRVHDVKEAVEAIKLYELYTSK